MPRRRPFLTICIIVSIFAATAAFGFPVIRPYQEWFLLSPQSAASLTAIGTPLTENFDTLSNDTVNLSSAVPTGWAFLETGSNADGLYIANSGTSSGGQTYSYGTTGSTERAFGQLRSSALVSTLGASFVNNTGTTITSLDISYVGEQWRLGAVAAGRQDKMDFQYSLDATSLSTGTWTDFDSLDFASPITTGTVGALNGNSAANRTARSGTISSLNIPNGSTVWIRWNDFDAATSDDGLAIDDFSITPQSTAPTIAVSDIGFGNVNVGTTSSLNVTVQNTGTADLVLGTASITGTGAANFSVPTSPSGTTVAPGNSTLIQVQFTPTTRGAKSATLTFSSNASSGDNASALTGTGVAPQIGLSTTSIGFGSQTVNTTSSQMALTISNDGDTGQNLNINSLNITGTNASDFVVTDATLPATIMPGSNLTVHLTFTPGGGGSRAATLTIDNNDPLTPMPTVTLTGTGVVPTTVDLSSGAYQVVEGTSQVTLTLVRGGDTSTAFTVDLATSNATAMAGSCGQVGADYEAVSQTISFGLGETTKVVDIPVCADLLSESPAELFDVTLSNPTAGVTLGSVNSASIAIIDAATEFTSSVQLDAAAGQVVSSDITVTGYQGNVSGMRVTLFGLSATASDDLDALLVDPAGHKYALVGDIGGATNLNNVTLTLEDTGTAGFVLDGGPVSEGENYEPTNCESPVTDFAGSPVGPIVEPGCGPVLTNTLASAFGGQNPNGPWTLYLRNDGGAPLGTPVTNVSISSWGIQFIAPTAAPVGLSGRVVDTAGRGIRGAAVTVSGGDLAEAVSVRTDELGRYGFGGLHPSQTYIVSARAKQMVIADAARVVTLLDDLAGIDFVAVPRE